VEHSEAALNIPVDTDINMTSIPSTNDTKRWVSLADRLNPNRPSFDAQLKANWKTMSKKQRKQIIKEDKIAIAALKSRGTSQQLPFTAEEDDHCETSPVAYTHIAPILQLIANRLDKKPCDLLIYDPYYCAGKMVDLLNKLGLEKVSSLRYFYIHSLIFFFLKIRQKRKYLQRFREKNRICLLMHT
jgi:hypothetical protein